MSQFLAGHTGISGNTVANTAVRNAHDAFNNTLVPFSQTDATRFVRQILPKRTALLWDNLRYHCSKVDDIHPKFRF